MPQLLINGALGIIADTQPERVLDVIEMTQVLVRQRDNEMPGTFVAGTWCLVRHRGLDGTHYR